MRFSILYSGEQILSFKSCLVFNAGDSLNNLKIFASEIRRLKTADSICLSPYIILYLYFVIKAVTCSLAEVAPPQPQDNVAMKRALLSLRI